MKRPAYSNYALRSPQLAAVRAPDPVRVGDVMRVHRLARPHTVKIMHELGRAGFVTTKRARGGGFRLARPAGDIVGGDVTRLTDGPLGVVGCFNPATNACPLIGICRLSRGLHDATLADIAANRDPLALRIAAAKRSDSRASARMRWPT